MTRSIAVVVAVAACGGSERSAPPRAAIVADAGHDATALEPLPAEWLTPIAVLDARARCADEASCAARCEAHIAAACRALVDRRGGEPTSRDRAACALGDGASCARLAAANTDADADADAQRTRWRTTADAADAAGCAAGDHAACARDRRVSAIDSCARGHVASCIGDATPLRMQVLLTHCAIGEAWACAIARLPVDATLRPSLLAHARPIAQRRCDGGDRDACHALVPIVFGDPDPTATRAALIAWLRLASRDCGDGDRAACDELVGVARRHPYPSMPPSLQAAASVLVDGDWAETRACMLAVYGDEPTRGCDAPRVRAGFARDAWRPPPPVTPPPLRE